MVGLHVNVLNSGYTEVTTFLKNEIPYLLTYLLTPWCRVLLEKLTGLQLVKKFPAFYNAVSLCC